MLGVAIKNYVGKYCDNYSHRIETLTGLSQETCTTTLLTKTSKLNSMAKYRSKITSTLIISLLLITTCTMFFVSLGSANPYMRDYVAPDAYTEPPEISIYLPENNSLCSKVHLSVNVSLPKSLTASFSFLNYVYFKADWLQNKTYLYASKGVNDQIRSDNPPERQYFFYSDILTGVPEGYHSLIIYAGGGGWYPPQGINQSGFFIDGNSTIFFTVDNTPPKIMLSSIEKRTYHTSTTTSDFPVTIVANEPVTKTSYSLDGQTNITFTGNTTLAGLPVGEHNLTVYAWDFAGNIGKSQTVTFSLMRETFPTVQVVAISTIIVAVIVVTGLLVYFKKYKRT
jgi:hypothetical protein